MLTQQIISNRRTKLDAHELQALKTLYGGFVLDSISDYINETSGSDTMHYANLSDYDHVNITRLLLKAGQRFSDSL